MTTLIQAQENLMDAYRRAIASYPHAHEFGRGRRVRAHAYQDFLKAAAKMGYTKEQSEAAALDAVEMFKLEQKAGE